MHADPNTPAKHPETELHSDLQSFCGPALLPDHPGLEPRVRRGRPEETKPASSKANDAGREQNTQSE